MQNASLHDEVTNESDFVERSAFSFFILRLRDDMTYSLVHPLFSAYKKSPLVTVKFILLLESKKLKFSLFLISSSTSKIDAKVCF